jgi:VIT1/CCC1 family predicted Fe2+/Mn2+ transporter
VAVLGVVPILFVIFGWSSNSWTGIVSACVSGVILALLPSTRGREIRRELAKRLHL